jgi:uncharacterized protein YjbI with pentapeptide repeats
MERADALSLLKSGKTDISEWNRRRSTGDPVPTLENADLTGADLKGIQLDSRNAEIVNLKGATLNEANLQGADLSGSFLFAANFQRAKLNGAKLQKTNLTEANLTGTDCRGAVLTGAILLRAKVAGTNFRDADLQDAELREMEGFYGYQLAGAAVSGAKLPDEIKSFAALGTIEKACADARTVFLAMLLGCVYTVLTIGTTTDSALITNSSSTPLPIISTQIPIVGFYVVAPLILFGFYLYFHLCMQTIWERLGTLPAVLPDGRHLDKAADPWLLLGLVESHFTRLRRERTFLSYVQSGVSIALAWWTVPLTLFSIWLRYLKAHDWQWTATHVILFVGAIGASLYLYRRASAALTDVRQSPFSLERARRLMRWDGVIITFAMLILSVILTYLAVQGRIFPAALEDAEVSTKPPGWTGDPSKEESELRQVKPAILSAANLKGAVANRAFLVRANLRRADLAEATLQRADLRGADFQWTDLRGAVLVEADLRGVNLTMANLTKADLRQTSLTAVQATSACLDGTTKLPEIKEFLRMTYKRPPQCDTLWGTSRSGK